MRVLLTNEGSEIITIEGLKDIGLKAIDKKFDWQLSLRDDSVLHLVYRGLKDIGLKVVEKGLSNATFSVLKCLEQIGLKCAEKRLDEDILQRCGFVTVGGSSITKEVMEALKEVGVEAADKELEKFSGFPAVVPAITGLKKIGLLAVDNDLTDYTVSISCVGLLDIGIKVVEKKIGFLGNPLGLLFITPSELKFEEDLRDETYVIENLKQIANRAYKKDKFKETSRISMVNIWVLGAFVKKYLPEYAEEMAKNLNESKMQVIKDLFGSKDIREKAIKYIEERFPELNDELSAFEKLYNKNIKNNITNI